MKPHHVHLVLWLHFFIITDIIINITRFYAALRAADLDWIVGPEHSLGRKEEGRNKQKRDTRGVTTDLLDV